MGTTMYKIYTVTTIAANFASCYTFAFHDEAEAQKFAAYCDSHSGASTAQCHIRCLTVYDSALQLMRVEDNERKK